MTAEFWKDAAACRGADPKIFFSEDTKFSDQALSYCTACPVQFECLEYALTIPSTNGTWGGRTERQRKQMRRLRMRA